MKLTIRQRATTSLALIVVAAVAIFVVSGPNRVQAAIPAAFWFVEDYDDEVPYILENDLVEEDNQMGRFRSLNLSKAQRAKIARIQLEFNGRRRPLIQRMSEEREVLRAHYFRGSLQDMTNAFEAMMSTRRNIFALQVKLRKRVLAILTASQRKMLNAS